MDIWTEYKRRYQNECLNVDGIVDAATYSKQEIKLLFILKETNQLYDSLVNFLNEGAPDGGKVTWQPICKWAEAILDGTKNGDYSTPEERAVVLKRIASINVKKSPGGSTSNSSYLVWAEKNSDLLIKQINMINPDVIALCCDTSGNTLVNERILDGVETRQFKNTDLWYSTWNRKIFVCARHPNRAPNSYIDAFAAFHNEMISKMIV